MTLSMELSDCPPGYNVCFVKIVIIVLQETMMSCILVSASHVIQINVILKLVWCFPAKFYSLNFQGLFIQLISELWRL